MAKKRIERENDERRRSRKEILRERRYERQTREIRLAVAGVVGLLVLVLLAAVIIEYVVRPRQAVATVNETPISLEDWQNRVRYQRAQFIISLEDQLEAFQDLNLVQQFSQQQLSLLQQPEVLGELILEQMIDEEVIRQAAVSRGIDVTDAEVDELIGEQFSYYGGELPTPTATASPTIEPTPSLTPVPTNVITEVLPTNTPAPTPTLGPTMTPRPTATAMSAEAFQEEFSTMIGRFRDMGVSEETYRSVVRAQIFRDKLADQLAETEQLSREAEMASIYTLTFDSDEMAQAAAQAVDELGYLEVWNRIRSGVAVDGESEDDGESPSDSLDGTASEVLWRTQEQLEQQYGAAVAEAAFELPLQEPSSVLTQTVPMGNAEGGDQTVYYIVQPSGREMRDLSPSAFDNLKQQLVSDLVTQQREGGLAQITIDPVWRTRVPTTPILDPSFLAPPPTQPAVAPTQAPVATPTVVPEADS